MAIMNRKNRKARMGVRARDTGETNYMDSNRYNDNVENVQGEKEVDSSASHEPGKVPSQVPSADLEKKFYEHHKLWNCRAAA